MKFQFDNILQAWKEVDPKGFADQIALYHQGFQWFHDHPVAMTSFMFPSDDKLHFLFHSLQMVNDHNAIGHILQALGAY